MEWNGFGLECHGIPWKSRKPRGNHGKVLLYINNSKLVDFSAF
jgi:hypothetical protein